ncbi:MAG: patatin-like phospholipase family protein [Chloroflexi bacterium]|nr:patatin-like phospholipase family protein [Chloroflexota bacterium]
MPTQPVSFTLALAGGGAKCAAHAGVLAAFEEAQLPVSAIAGVSAGGLVAVLYGLGLSPAAIRDYVAGTNLLDVWEMDLTRRAIFGVERVRAHVRAAAGDKTFADLRFPVVVIAADLRTGREVRLRTGRLDEALLATMAIPGIFTPIAREGLTLVDGGIVNPLPVDAARALGSPVVAVDLLYHGAPTGESTQLFEARGPMRYATELARRLQLTGIMDSAHQAALISAHRLVEYSLNAAPPDVLLRPEAGRVGLFAFDLAGYAFQQGRAAAGLAMPQLQALAHPPAPEWQTRLSRLWRQVWPARK